MRLKTSSERMADAMERTRREWQLRIKAEAQPAVRPNLDQFTAALRVVEADHQLVLDKVRALDNALSLVSEAGECEYPQVIATLHNISDFLATRFADHLQEEERTLFPFLERSVPEGAVLVARLRAEHAAILDKRQEIANCLQLAAELCDGGLNRTVLFDLIQYGLELWELLVAHAHVETQAIRNSMEMRGATP